jgi:hypothetical protein
MALFEKKNKTRYRIGPFILKEEVELPIEDDLAQQMSKTEERSTKEE